MFLASFSSTFVADVMAIDGSDPDPTDKIPIKRITATKGVYSGDIRNIIDGNRQGSNTLFSGTGDVWITLELDKVFIIDQIILSARRNWANYRYQIEGSLDNSQWNNIKGQGDYEYWDNDYEPWFQTMNFYSGASSPYSMSSFSAKFVRIYIDEQGGYYPGYLYEIELYGALASTGLDAPELPFTITSDHSVYSGSLDNLNDGLIGDHALFQTSYSNEPVSLTLDLGGLKVVSQIVIYASRNWANYGYKIEASRDNTYFFTIKGEDPYDYYSYDYEPFVQIMDFNSKASDLYVMPTLTASIIRITFHDGGGHYYPGYIREIDIFTNSYLKSEGYYMRTPIETHYEDFDSLTTLFSMKVCCDFNEYGQSTDSSPIITFNIQSALDPDEVDYDAHWGMNGYRTYHYDIVGIVIAYGIYYYPDIAHNPDDWELVSPTDSYPDASNGPYVSVGDANGGYPAGAINVELMGTMASVAGGILAVAFPEASIPIIIGTEFFKYMLTIPDSSYSELVADSYDSGWTNVESIMYPFSSDVDHPIVSPHSTEMGYVTQIESLLNNKGTYLFDVYYIVHTLGVEDSHAYVDENRHFLNGYNYKFMFYHV